MLTEKVNALPMGYRIVEYYAKSENSKGYKETVSHHLNQVAVLCKENASAFDCPTEGTLLGLFHDFGKYSNKFQAVLTKQMQGVDHSSPGAAALYSYLFGAKTLDKVVNSSQWVLVAAVAAHHGTLNYGCDGLVIQVLSGQSAHGQGGKTLSLCGEEQMRVALRQFQKEIHLEKYSLGKESFSKYDNPYLARMLYGRMLFSALVDADYSASALNENPDYLELTTEKPLDAEELSDLLDFYCSKLQANSKADPKLNKIRNQVFSCCRAVGSQEDGVFTLTAPTGSGKTMAMLAFAIEQLKRGKRRVFFVLPFLSITEQNAREYRKIIPSLLECHSQKNLSDEQREFAERWSSNAIVTTSVQFFEGLFASKSTDCRRLHQVANSVIIFDEAQTLPVELAKATLDTINILCQRYHCTVVFSTATQPAFQYLPNVNWAPREIISHGELLFEACKRTQVNWRVKEPTEFSSVAKKMAKQNSVCCIVNLRRHSKELFAYLEELCEPETIFLMTTDLCPKHRENTLKIIRKRLDEGLPCRLVATQCIEAGVDISFDAMYRALAPLESIIQAAGRCNRHNEIALGIVTVFIPNTEQLYPGDFYEAGANAVKTVLSRHPIDINKLEDMDEYYKTLYKGGTISEKPELKSAIEDLNFEKTSKEYKLIKQEGYRVLVPYGPEIEQFEAIRAEALRAGITPKLIRQMAPIVVSSYNRDMLEEYCVQLPLQIKGKRADYIESGFYVLEDYGMYQDKLGLLVEPVENLLY